MPLKHTSVGLQSQVSVCTHGVWERLGENMLILKMCQFPVGFSWICWMYLVLQHWDFLKTMRLEALQLIELPCMYPDGLLACVCVCVSASTVQQHLLLYLLWTNITITDVLANPRQIDCYCSTLFHISRKSLTFDPRCSSFVFLPLLMSEVAQKKKGMIINLCREDTHFRLSDKALIGFNVST